MPLLSIIEDDNTRNDLRDLACRYNRETITGRGMDMEAQVLETIRDLKAASADDRVSVKEVAG